MARSINTAVLIDAIAHLDHRTGDAETACLALKALGSDDLADRYADASARMAHWASKPDSFEFAGLSFGDSVNAWSDEDVAAHKRDEAGYWLLVGEIKAAFGLGDAQ